MSRWRLCYLRVYNCRQIAASEQCTDTYAYAYRLECDMAKGNKTRSSTPCSAIISFLGRIVPSINTLSLIPFSETGNYLFYSPRA